MLHALYQSHDSSRLLTFALLVLALVLAFWLGTSTGAAGTDWSLPISSLIASFSTEQPNITENIVLNIRFPRVLMALLVGAALAVSGASLQGICRNPLADPGLLGISSGAAVGAVSVILFARYINIAETLRPYIIPFAAFLGAALTTFTVYRLAQVAGRLQIATLLLVGIAINALGAAIISGYSFIADDQSLRLITFWLMGSLASATWATVCILFFSLGVALYIIYRQRHAINLMLLGEENAEFSGVDVDAVKRHLLWMNALIVGVAVAFSGIIGFIGLVVPHILRVQSDTNYRYLIVNSALLGAALLAVADVTSRLVIMPSELPVGILTSLIGAPFFILLLIQQKRKMGFVL